MLVLQTRPRNANVTLAGERAKREVKCYRRLGPLTDLTNPLNAPRLASLVAGAAGLYDNLLAPSYFETHGLGEMAAFHRAGGQLFTYAEDILILAEALEGEAVEVPGERAKRASLDEDEHTRDEVREMIADGVFFLITIDLQLACFGLSLKQNP